MKTLKILLRGLGGLCVFACILCGICQWLLGFGGETAFWFFSVAMCIVVITELFMGFIEINYEDSSKSTQQKTSSKGSFTQKRTYTKTSHSSSTIDYGINFNVKE